MITPQPTWSIYDSSKIQAYMDCPRRYFYEYILGFRTEGFNIHLIFGEALHLALEHIERNKAAYAHGKLALLLAESYLIFYNKFRAHVSPEQELEASKVKTCDTAARILKQYIDSTANNPETCLDTEIAGQVYINETDAIAYRVDYLGTKNLTNTKFVRDHKTASYMGKTWVDAWDTSFQMGTYSHLLYSIFPEDEVAGIEINGLGVRAALKANELPHLRVPVYKSKNSMADWLWHANHYVDAIKADTAKVLEHTPEDQTLKAFPKNSTACTKYYGCPFLAICGQWDNPLGKCLEIEQDSSVEVEVLDTIPTRTILEPPIGFVTSWWNPLDKTIRPINKIINIDSDGKVLIGPTEAIQELTSTLAHVIGGIIPNE